MSQNVLRTKGSSRGPNTTALTTTKLATTASDLKKQRQATNTSHLHSSKTNSNTSHLDENHNTRQVDVVKEQQMQTATPEQIRLAHLLGNKSSDDPELLEKIKQIAELMPLREQDDIIMALHEFDYDVARTIDFLLEGGDLTQDWVTAGVSRNKSNKTSTTNNGDEANDNYDVDLTHVKHPVKKGVMSKKNDINGGTKSSSARGAQTSGRNHNVNGTSAPRNFNKRHGNARDITENLDENMEALNIKENEHTGQYRRGDNKMVHSETGDLYNGYGDEQQHISGNGNYQDQYQNGRMKRNNGPVHRTNGGSGTGHRNGGVNRNSGSGRNTNSRSAGGPHRTNENETKNTDAAMLDANAEQKNDMMNEIVLSNVVTSEPANLPDQNGATTRPLASVVASGAPTSNGVAGMSAAAIVAGGGRKNDNMRDIGTWSNEQAAAEKAKEAARLAAGAKQGHFGRNSAGNNKTSRRGKTNEEWDNDEEWQGDLSQTQIFTSTSQQQQQQTQKKSLDDQTSGNRDNFPIGHFNAAEATQKIKNAVGIGNVNMSSTSTTATTAPAPVATTTQSKQPVVNNLQSTTTTTTTTTNNRLNKFGSIKVPPPSTKIPKSAVVMPDAGNNSTNFSLDVQFGVDFDNHHLPSSATTSKTSSKTTTSSAVTNEVKKQPVKDSTVPAVAKTNVKAPTTSISLSSVPTPVAQPIQSNISSNVKSKTNSKPVSVSVNPSKTSGNGLPSAPSSFSATTSTDKNSNMQQLASASGNLGSNNLTAAAVKLISTDTSIVNVVNSTNKAPSNSQMPPSNTMPSSNTSSNTNTSSNNNNLPSANVQHHGLDNSKLSNNQKSTTTNNNNNTGNTGSNFTPTISQQKPASKSHMTSSSFNMNQLNNNHHSTSDNMHQQSQQHHYQQQQHPQQNLKDSASNQSLSNMGSGASSSSQQQMLNMSPPNAINLNKQSNNNLANQSMQQIQQLQQMSSNNGSSSTNQLASLNVSNSKQQQQQQQPGGNNPMPPPPGVNLVNPGVNNQFLMGLPFQNFPYFDHGVDGNSFVQMYNHLAGVPPGVGGAGGSGNTQPQPYGPSNDGKFNRNGPDANPNGNNSQLSAQLSQQQQQQQQQTINLIPGLSNIPFFFPTNYYPNMFIQSNPQAFSNKPPYGAFNNNTGNGNNGVYDQDQQGKDYSNYNQQQPQIKPSGSNLSNVSELGSVGGYQKNVDKSAANAAGGYHTPPPNYTSSLMNQPHPNVNQSNAPMPQYPYIASMMGGSAGSGSNHNQNLVNPHGGIQQDNMNSRGIGNQTVSKPISKTNYPQNSWN